MDQPGNRPRRLTPRSAPDSWASRREAKVPDTVSDTQAYKQFGNAVVVPVVEFLAKAMKRYIEKAIEEEALEGKRLEKALAVTRRERRRPAAA